MDEQDLKREMRRTKIDYFAATGMCYLGAAVGISSCLGEGLSATKRVLGTIVGMGIFTMGKYVTFGAEGRLSILIGQALNEDRKREDEKREDGLGKKVDPLPQSCLGTPLCGPYEIP